MKPLLYLLLSWQLAFLTLPTEAQNLGLIASKIEADKINSFEFDNIISNSNISSLNRAASKKKDSTRSKGFKMFRIKQENDLYQYWYQSDKDFTDGLHFELFHPIFENKASNWILIGFKKNAINTYALSIGQDIFTPEDISLEGIDSTDRPYSALLYLTYSKYSNNYFKGRQLSSNFYLGLSGKYAFGDEVQNGVHSILGNQPANGWDNQLSTGLMLDYDVLYRQLIPLNTSIFETNVFGKAHVGTIYNYLEVGCDFKIGFYGDSYLNDNGEYNKGNSVKVDEENFDKLSKSKLQMIPKKIRKLDKSAQIAYLNKRLNRKLQYYLHFGTQLSYNFHDGSSEGSYIQFAANAYELENEDLNLVLLQGFYGITFQYSSFIMSFNRFLSNNIYEEGNLFGFGEISLSYVFN